MANTGYTALSQSYHPLHYRKKLQQLAEACFNGKCLDRLNKYELHKKINHTLINHHQGEESLKYKLAASFRKKGYIAAFEVRARDSRADFVVINGDSKCFEVKSKIDTLRRLDKQSLDYQAVFEYNTVVVDGKHLKEIETLLPAHYGIWYFEKNKRVQYRVAERSPYLNPLCQLEMLTKQERQRMFGQPDVEWVLANFSPEVINSKLKETLKLRYAKRWQFVMDHWKQILPIDLQFFFNKNIDPQLIYAD